MPCLLQNALHINADDKSLLPSRDLLHSGSADQVSAAHGQGIHCSLLTGHAALDGSALLLVLAQILPQLLDLGFHILRLPLQLLHFPRLHITLPVGDCLPCLHWVCDMCKGSLCCCTCKMSVHQVHCHVSHTCCVLTNTAHACWHKHIW